MNITMKTAILASQNRNKIKELQAILAKHGYEVIARDDAGIPKDDIEETGTTFEENSALKASAIMDMIASDPSLERYKDSPVIADDTGLMVDALGGAPGVYSARYAGEGCTYDDNNKKLLSELAGVPEGKRGAKFVTVITMIRPGGGRLTARGECSGRIAEEKRGTEGFGYDPVFIPDGSDETFAEMGPEVKNRISHRARALEEMERLLG